MAKYLNNLKTEDLGYFEGRLVRRVIAPLIWVDGIKRREIMDDFQSDGASVPRLPIIYSIWGDRAHREAFGHDHDYRIDGKIIIVESEEINLLYPNSPIPEKYIVSRESVSKEDADWYFRETIRQRVDIVNGKEVNPYGYGIYQPMYLAVRFFGASSFHRMKIADSFKLDG